MSPAPRFLDLTTAAQATVLSNTLLAVRRCGHVEEIPQWERGHRNAHERDCGDCRAVEMGQRVSPSRRLRGEW